MKRCLRCAVKSTKGLAKNAANWKSSFLGWALKAVRALVVHAIQPFYAGLLARACGLTLDLKAEGDAIVIATR